MTETMRTIVLSTFAAAAVACAAPHAFAAPETAGASVSLADARLQVSSYLKSIDYPADGSGVRSLTVGADLLRDYLRNPAIVRVSFVLAHEPAWSLTHYGQFSKYSNVTLVITGLDASGGLVLNERSEVLGYTNPCAQACAGPGADVLTAVPAPSRVEGGGISLTDANAQIQSYVNSTGDTASLRTLSFDAPLVRDYLSNPNIQRMTFMLAHNRLWAQTHFGEISGYKNLALVIVGVDGRGALVLDRNEQLLDQSSGWP